MGKLPSLLFLGAGIFFVVMAGQATWQVTAALRAMGDAPEATTVKAAPAGRWVRLVDAEVRCGTRRTSGKAAYYDVRAKDGSETLLYQAMGDTPCEQLALEGGFLEGSYTGEWVQKKLGVAGPEGIADFRIFSQTLTPGFMRQTLVLAIPFLLLGLVGVAIGIRAYRRAARPG